MISAPSRTRRCRWHKSQHQLTHESLGCELDTHRILFLRTFMGDAVNFTMGGFLAALDAPMTDFPSRFLRATDAVTEAMQIPEDMRALAFASVAMEAELTLTSTESAAVEAVFAEALRIKGAGEAKEAVARARADLARRVREAQQLAKARAEQAALAVEAAVEATKDAEEPCRRMREDQPEGEEGKRRKLLEMLLEGKPLEDIALAGLFRKSGEVRVLAAIPKIGTQIQG